jgi:hypothetical protein
MPIVFTGNSGEIPNTANSGSDSITIPVDCDCLVLGISGYVNYQYFFGQAAITIGGNALTLGKATRDDVADSDKTAIFYIVNPPKGVQTLAWDFGGTSACTDGGKIRYSFLKGVDQVNPVRGTGEIVAEGVLSNGTVSTGSLEAFLGDLIFLSLYGWDTTLNPTSITWTNASRIDGDIYNNSRGETAYAKPSGTVAILADPNGNSGDDLWLILNAVVFKAAPSNFLTRFSSDVSCKALWRFENGALTDDSKGTNTLTNNASVVASTSDKKEGGASADLESGSSQYFSITDANLDSGFPLKSGDDGTFTISCWIKAESLAADMNIWSKYTGTNNLRSVSCVLLSTGILRLRFGYSSGTLYQQITHGSTLSTGNWYHITIRHRASDRNYRISIRDASGNIVGTDVFGTLTNALSVTSAPFVIGADSDGIYNFDGLIDEFVVFDRVLGSNEVANIAKGLFTKNNFSSDPSVKALWNFEYGALTADSKGNNTLTNNGTVIAEAGDYKEGNAAADFESGSSQYFSITNANLDSGFPSKLLTVSEFAKSNGDDSSYLATIYATKAGQSFQGDGNYLDKITLYLYKTGSPTGNMVVKIYKHSGTFGTSSLPDTDNLLATSLAVAASSVTSTSVPGQDVVFLFIGSNKIFLDASMYYTFVLEWDGGPTSSDFIHLLKQVTSDLYDGNAFDNYGGWSAKADDDHTHLINSISTLDFTICAWIKMESAPSTHGYNNTITSKYDRGVNKRIVKWTVQNISSEYRLSAFFGYNNGQGYAQKNHASNLSLATWYHVTLSYRNSDKAVALRIRDTNGSIVGNDLETSVTNEMSNSDAPFLIGGALVSAVVEDLWDGLIDELVVFDRFLKSYEATEIAKGHHGYTWSTTIQRSVANPRYFRNDLQDGLMFSGSHTWWTVQGPSSEGGAFSDSKFDTYLNWSKGFSHNFLRVWSNMSYHDYTPTVWNLDGSNKAIMDSFNQTYFDLLRARVLRAIDQGFYCSVLLFGSAVRFLTDWDDVFWNPDRNTSSALAAAFSTTDYTTFFTTNAAALDVQKALVAKTIDTLNDIDNIVWEVMNEAPTPTSADWQDTIMAYIRAYEAGKAKQHLIMMSGGGSINDNNASLLASDADIISPDSYTPYGFTEGGDITYVAKSVINDTDHIGGYSDPDDADVYRKWIWRAFCRGTNPIFMDSYDRDIDPYNDGTIMAVFDPVRATMGYIQKYAQLLDLKNTVPSSSFSSSGYALVNSGNAYLIYIPTSGGFTFTLPAGNWEYEWFNPNTGAVTATAKIAGGSKSYSTPGGYTDGVLFIWKRQENNFIGESNLAAHYKFESQAQEVDSQGNNTLSETGTPIADTVGPRQGAASAYLDASVPEGFYRTDINLDPSFPLKSNDSTKNISVACWIYVSGDTAETNQAIFAKYDTGSGNYRSFLISAVDNTLNTDFKIRVLIGYNSGISSEETLHGSALAYATWYHVTVTYQNSTKQVCIRVRDTNGDVVGTDVESTKTLDANGITVTTAPITIGYMNPTPTYKLTGNLDELLIFKDILTAAEATALAKGLYPTGEVALIPGTTCWGHYSATQANLRSFRGWTGTGSVERYGNRERLKLEPSQYMISEIVPTGGVPVILGQDTYNSYILKEDWEVPSALEWVIDADGDYSYDLGYETVALHGKKSAFLHGENSFSYCSLWSPVLDLSEIWYFFRFRYVGTLEDTFQEVITLFDEDNFHVNYFMIDPDEAMLVIGESTMAYKTGLSFSGNTTYYVWGYYKSGAAPSTWLKISPTRSFYNASALSFATSWNTTFKPVEKIQFQSGLGQPLIVDQIRFDNKPIGPLNEILMSYRTGATKAACEAASWTEYTIPFTSAGFAQVKLEA